MSGRSHNIKQSALLPAESLLVGGGGRATVSLILLAVNAVPKPNGISFSKFSFN